MKINCIVLLHPFLVHEKLVRSINLVALECKSKVGKVRLNSCFKNGNPSNIYLNRRLRIYLIR